MEDLAARVSTCADRYSAQLPADLVAQLKQFAPNWSLAFKTQESGKEQVQEKKAQTGAARAAYEKGLLQVMHEVAALHPGDVAACRRYFVLSLLKTTSYTAAPAPEPAAPVV